VNPFGVLLFDDWRILLCTDICDGQPKTSFLVWGMGVTYDENGPGFFWKQIENVFPVGGVYITKCLSTFNRLEKEGIAKGYWCLLTESDDTSSFSYEARKMTEGERKYKWLQEIKVWHNQGKGISSSNICKHTNN
jgi:hypothetical protein